VARQADNLVELLGQSIRRYAHRPLYGTKREGSWQWTTYMEFEEQVRAFRAVLADQGIGAGDRVAIVSDNRLEWAVAAYATYGLGAAFVPMYEAQRPEEWKFILADSGARIALAAGEATYEHLQAMKPEVAGLRGVFGLDLPSDHPSAYRRWLAWGTERPRDAVPVAPHTPCGLIYTSGTTGPPKGVVLSHRNITSNVHAVQCLFPIDPSDRSLSFLPWAHSFGQTVEVHTLIHLGFSAALNDDIAHLIDNLREVQPTILVAVPRIFNRLHERVVLEMQRRPAAVRRLFERGLQAASRRNQGESLGPVARLGLSMDERWIFSRVRERLGGRLRFAISGSAALDREVAEFIDALGIDVYEGYGLTETSPIVAANYPGHRRLGSVGPPIPGVRVDIDTSVTGAEEEGELIVYGPNVMQGYHNRPEDNARAFTSDGGFRTGDLGRFDRNGYLHITGRLKEQYKLSNGKYVMPAPLEEKLKLSPLIDNVMLFGDNKPYNVALVVPSEQMLEAWAQRRGIELGDPRTDPRVHEWITAELERHSASFKSYEKPRNHLITLENFTTENGMLTPTLKLRRRNVLARYGQALEALYQQSPPTFEAAS
jgi:long-chain acyl-CoA synthetase